MKLKCPACGALASLDVLITAEGAREAVLVALQFPAPLGKRLIQYLALFRPATRDLSFDRVASLLSEILPDIQAGKIKRAGREWNLLQDYWLVGIDTVLAARDAGRLTLPLKGHGYLYEVLAGLVDKAEGQKERESEARRSSGGPLVPAGYKVVNAEPQSHAREPPPDKAKGQQYLDSLKQKMGMRPRSNDEQAV